MASCFRVRLARVATVRRQEVANEQLVQPPKSVPR